MRAVHVLFAFVFGAVSMQMQSAKAADVTFEYVTSIGSEGSGPGQFKYIEDFAFAKNGDLLVTDASHAWVQVFDKATGKYVARFGCQTASNR
jgi:hypothetical protein